MRLNERKQTLKIRHYKTPHMLTPWENSRTGYQTLYAIILYLSNADSSVESNISRSIWQNWNRGSFNYMKA